VARRGLQPEAASWGRFPKEEAAKNGGGSTWKKITIRKGKLY
jgi:hypothetical protein